INQQSDDQVRLYKRTVTIDDPEPVRVTIGRKPKMTPFSHYRIAQLAKVFRLRRRTMPTKVDITIIVNDPHITFSVVECLIEIATGGTPKWIVGHSQAGLSDCVQIDLLAEVVQVTGHQRQTLDGLVSGRARGLFSFQL